jgi:hypothetical protein
VPVPAPPAAAVRVCAGALKRCNPGVGVSRDSGHHRVSRRRLRTCDCHGASSRRPGEPCRCCLRPRRLPARAVSSQRVCRVRVLLRSKRRPCVAGSLLLPSQCLLTYLNQACVSQLSQLRARPQKRAHSNKPGSSLEQTCSAKPPPQLLHAHPPPRDLCTVLSQRCS